MPLDPRHRLLTSKYNPARTFTAEGTVGIGGVYMCVYGMDSPGGYQLVGKTLPIWSRDRNDKEPWLLKPFDQVSYYEVTEESLMAMRKSKDKSQYLQVDYSVFNLAKYEAFLAANKASIDSFKASQKVAFDAEVQLWGASIEDEGVDAIKPAESLDEGHVSVAALSYGSVWKVLVSVGDVIEEGQDVVILEAMKMETKVTSPSSGVVVSVTCMSGRMVKTGDVLLVLKP